MYPYMTNYLLLKLTQTGLALLLAGAIHVASQKISENGNEKLVVPAQQKLNIDSSRLWAEERMEPITVANIIDPATDAQIALTSTVKTVAIRCIGGNAGN